MGLERLASNTQGGDEFWIDVQKKAFTRWANSYLVEKNHEINDLYQDLSDGLRLIELLEMLSEKPISIKYNKEPKFRIHKLENLNIVFNYLAKNNIQVTNIGSSDILDGNSKLILGLIWTIIKRYQVADIAVDGVSGKEGLLLWCNRLLDIYKMKITNFTSQWSNGLAFSYLIHAHDPTLIDIKNISDTNAIENLTIAFSILETKFSIPSLINPEDLQGKVDEKSVLTYVSMVFQEFAPVADKTSLVASNDDATLSSIDEDEGKNVLTAVETYSRPFDETPSLRLLVSQTTSSRRASFSSISPFLSILYPSAPLKIVHHVE